MYLQPYGIMQFIKRNILKWSYRTYTSVASFATWLPSFFFKSSFQRIIVKKKNYKEKTVEPNVTIISWHSKKPLRNTRCLIFFNITFTSKEKKNCFYDSLQGSQAIVCNKRKKDNREVTHIYKCVSVCFVNGIYSDNYCKTVSL